MTSLWAKYKAEVSDERYVEYEWGFFSYVIHDQVLCIEHAYVEPEFRRQGKFKELLREAQGLAKDAGLKKVVGCVSLVNKKATDALKCHLAAGAEPYLCNDGKIWLRLEVENG